jgi:serine/threonine protein kinase
VHESADAERPDRILADRYRLVEFIARGGMAEVWEGHDVLLARPVAVKLPHPHLGRQEAFRKRFRREAVAAARLSHPNVVAIFDTGTDNEDYFIVMERVDGPSLREFLVPDRPLPVEKAVSVARQVASALDYAHRQGVVHRDIKPANILIGRDDMVKVADFGIAKAALGDDTTQTAATLGTARYLAPEQVEGGVPDHRGDIYSLGVVLYEMVCGRPPFKADNEVALALQHLRAEPPRPTAVSPAVPPWLEDIVLTALAKSPDERFGSANQLRVALDRGPAWTGSGIERRAGTASSAKARGGLLGRGWTRPRVPVGASQGSAHTPTTTDPARQWASPPVFDATPTHRGRTGTGDTTFQSPSDPPFPHSTQAFEAPPAPPASGRPTGRGRYRGRLVPFLALALAVAAAVVAGVIVSDLGQSTSHHPPATSQGAGGAQGTPLVVTSATAFDPVGNDGDRRDLSHLTDGDPNTIWLTEWYTTRQFGGTGKPGVGFVLNMDQSHKLRDLVLASPTPGYNVSVYLADSSPSDLQSWGQPVKTVGDAPGRAVVPLDGRQGSHVLVLFTYLSPTVDGGGYIVKVSDAQLTG